MSISGILHIGFFLAFAIVGAQAAEGLARPKTEERSTMSDEDVAAVIERAKSDPNVLWELQNVALDKTFLPLRRFWGSGEGLREMRLNSRRRGEDSEREWIELQKSIGRDPEIAERLFPVAKEVLLSHPNLEDFLASNLQRENERVTSYYKGISGDRTEPPRECEFIPYDLTYQGLLNFLPKIPGDGVIHIAGSFLSSPYFPPQDQGDYTRKSPAGMARGMLAKLVKDRHWEEIPQDIEGARKWWSENQHRFAAKLESQSVAPVLAIGETPASKLAASPTHSAPAIPTTTFTMDSQVWLFAVIGGLAVLLVASFWFYSRSARR